MRNALCLVAILGMLAPVGALAGEDEPPTRVAVAATGKTMSSTVDGRAARCPYFMVFDEKGELAEVLENPSRNVSGSAGPSCAEYLADHGITLLVAEQVGGKMIAALNGHEIRYILFSGSVKDAVARALKEDQ